MRAALNEAKKALGQTSPNPAVGAVLVVGDRIVSRGHHRGAGREHAEVECLRNFGASPPVGATLYVTLEPCSTEGRTPPCTDAILQAGVRNVVVGTIDVNPRHSGKGILQLRNAGGTTIAESEDSAVVWGMPGELVKADGADAVLALPDIAPRLQRLVPVR